jgi:predicted nucleic acid-binding Zn ribbon protein
MTGGAGGRGKPLKVAEALARYLERSGLGERLDATSVVDEWPDRVGPAIAAVARPVSVSNGVLFVAVDSSPWLMELRLMETDIRRRLNEGRETGRIQRIRFVLDGGEEPPPPMPWRGGKR